MRVLTISPVCWRVHWEQCLHGAPPGAGSACGSGPPRRTARAGPQLLGVEHVAPPPAPAVPELAAGDARAGSAGRPAAARSSTHSQPDRARSASRRSAGVIVSPCPARIVSSASTSRAVVPAVGVGLPHRAELARHVEQLARPAAVVLAIGHDASPRPAATRDPRPGRRSPRARGAPGRRRTRSRCAGSRVRHASPHAWRSACASASVARAEPRDRPRSGACAA